MKSPDKKNVINFTFSPTHPIKKKTFFFGRYKQLEDVVDAANQFGQHCVIFGERGVGKTSMANILVESVTNILSVKITCNRSDTFTSIWKRILKKINFTYTESAIGFKQEYKKRGISAFDYIENQDEISPSDVETVLELFPGTYFLIIVDEFDNLNDSSVRSNFSDLIKSLSDNVETVTIVLVGIADNVENLIANHRSLERCLKQVKMPRMSEIELLEIIDNGLLLIDMTMLGPIKEKVVKLSSGYPHFTHLLCKYAALNAITRNEDLITQEDLEHAISRSIDNANQQLRNSYQTATISTTTKSQWKDVLFSCALATTDEFNCFTTTDILKEFNGLRQGQYRRENITYNLGKFCREERGTVLEKVGEGRTFKYRFTNPMMKPYIKMHM